MMVKNNMLDKNNDLWGYLKEGMVMACDEVCGYKKNWKSNDTNTWWWNSWAKDEMQRKKRHIKN